MKTLTCMASLEVYYHCYKILEHFTYSCYYYCLCDRYHGCPRGPYPIVGKDYCCVCRTCMHYFLEKLDNIKHDSLELQNFYLNILKGLVEIVRVDPTACFWEGEVYYKYRKFITRTESQTCLRSVIDKYFNIDLCNF